MSRLPDMGELCKGYKAGVKRDDLTMWGCCFCVRVQDKWVKFVEEVDDVVPLAPNDTAYKRWSCHSSYKLLCKLCQTLPQWGPDFPSTRTRWMAGAAPHKSGRCQDQSRSDNFKQTSLDL